MSDGTSVGKIQLDIEISKSSISKELQGLNKIIGTGMQGTLSSFSSQMNGFVKNTISSMFSGLKAFSQMGKNANKEVAESASSLNAKYEKTKEKIAQINNELAKLYSLQDNIAKNYESMPSFSGVNKEESIRQMLSKDKNYNNLGTEIDKLELKLKGLTPELEQLKIKNEQLKDGFNKTDDGAKNASRGIKLFGDNSKKVEKKVGGLAAVINRSLMTVLRRMFIYNLIYKGLRGLISYMNSALKTNKQFTSSLNTVKTNLRVAFQPIYDFILPAIQALMRGIATASTYIAAAISSLFGKSYNQSYDAAKGIENARKSMDDYGSSAKKAQGVLAGFDDVDVLDLEKDEGFKMEMPDTSNIDLTGFDKFKNILQPTIASLERLGIALEPLKNFVSDSLKDFYNNFLVPVGQWTFGEGLPRFISAITDGLSKINWQPIKDGLNNLWNALTPFAINVGEGLLWFWENVLVPLGTWAWNELLPRFLDVLAEGINVLNVVIEVLKPLGMWLWDNFLKPLAEWTGGAIADILDGIAHAFKGIADYIKGIKDIISNSASFLDALVNVGVYLVEGLYKGVISAMSGIGSWLWNNLVKPIIDSVKELFGISSPSKEFAIIGYWLIEGLKQGLSERWYEITEFFKDALLKLTIFFQYEWDKIAGVVVNAWGSIKETWSTAGEWFNVTVITPITTIFNNLKDSIKNALSTAWTWVTDIWKGAGSWFKGIGEDMFNGMWDGLKSVWESIKSWISGTVEWLKDKLSFWKKSEDTMSSSGGSSSGGGSSGLGSGVGSAYYNNKQADISAHKDEISAISKTKDVDMDTAWSMWKANSIPQLARGGIVDQPTLAMVGERGREAVMPLENNTGWISELAGQIANAIGNIGGDSDEINITMPVYLDNEKIYEGQKKVQRRRGKSLVKGVFA